ncbi:MAG: ATP synthase F0 subunit B [Metamycoplasmataceae bacterium]
MEIVQIFSIIKNTTNKAEKFLESIRETKAPPVIGDVSNKVDQLMPSLYIMIATLGSLIFLGIILTCFFYKPVSKMVKRRVDFIQKNIDDSIIAREEAIKLNADAYKELIESRLRAADIVKDAKIAFEKEQLKIIEKNKKEAEKNYEQALLEINFLKEQFEQEKRDEIINTAIEISKKIIGESVQEKSIEKYYDQFMEEK